MSLRSIALATSILISYPVFSETTDEFVVNLKDPEYVSGVIRTNKGGVITAPDLRIQAQSIAYTNTKEVQKIVASGDLMMEYHGNFFVGEKLEYDLLTRTGYLIGGKTNVGFWYLGGDRIDLCSDGSITILGAFATTSVGSHNTWEIKTRTSNVNREGILHARDVRFNVQNIPLLWLPSYKSNLKKFGDRPIRYRVLWDKGLGPRLSARYRFYSSETFNAYARLDWRVTLGPGGALEAEYRSKDERTLFQTRNYGARDKEFESQNGTTRYRFQGIFKTKSEDEYTRFHMQWDKMSDEKMVNDFRSPDFEINTQKATYLDFSHYQSASFMSVTVHPLINRFQSLSQELPFGSFGIRPFEIWRTGIIMENYANASYLDYTFTSQIDELLRDRKSGRLETMNSLYRPFSLGGFTVTPRGGLIGIYYSESPDRNAARQFLFTYGGDANLRLSKRYQNIQHTVEPYAQYLGYTKPKVAVDDYFVFDIHDGYDKLDQLRFGLRQLFFSRSQSVLLPTLTLDLYSYAFWGARSFNQRIPKAFVDLEFNQPSYAILGGLGWNIQENVLDYGNIRFLWTLSSTFAFGVEFLHRSKFWWRKAVHDNFVVDFARPLDELLASPLSAKRNTFLTRAHFRLSPRWNLQLQTHHGWGRTNEPRYNGAKLDLYTMVTGSWRMKITYEYSPSDPFRLSYGFDLIK